MDDKPIREIKPVVIPAQYLLGGSLASASIALFPGLLVGLAVLFATEVPDPTEPGYMPGAFQWRLAFGVGLAASGLAFVVSMVLMGVSAFKGPGRTIYTIFPDRIEWCEGVWVRTWRHVAFRRVQGVEAAEGILQQTRGAGTVILLAREDDGPGNEAPASGGVKRVELANIARPKEVYELLQALVLEKNGPNKPLQQAGQAPGGCS